MLINTFGVIINYVTVHAFVQDDGLSRVSSLLLEQIRHGVVRRHVLHEAHVRKGVRELLADHVQGLLDRKLK